ncbi:MAG: SurA N-terminal domain-containing protein [Pseudomonadota bacterium]
MMFLREQPSVISRSSVLVTLTLALAFAVQSPVASAQSSAHRALVKVNGTPITDLDVRQRTNLIMMSAPDIQRKVRARAQRSFKAKDINQRFRAFLVKKQPKSRAEAQRLQKEFGRQIFARARASVRGTLRKRALSELVDDQLKVQEARKRGMLLGKDEVDGIFKRMADGNKMSTEQFGKFLRRQGIHPKSLKKQMRARASWQRVAGATLRRQVSIRSSDIEQVMSGDPAAERGKATELDLREVIFASSQAYDMKKYVAAEEFSRKFRGCKGLERLAKNTKGVRYRKLAKARASTIPEAARPVVLATAAGKMAPPVFTSRGVSLYAVCDRSEVADNDKARKQAKQKLQDKQLNTLARNLLRNLCQQAFIDPPLSQQSARCGES